MKPLSSFLAAITLFFAMTVPVWAEGTTRVQQSDGAVQIYHNVRMRLDGKTLWLRSPDRKDRLQIVSAACSYVHQIERCLPYQVFLHKAGNTHQLDIVRGVYYVNLTGAPHRLLHSQESVPPHSVLAFLHTVHGTFVQARGRLDVVK